MAWTLIYVGVGLILASPWHLVFLPAVLTMTHLTVTREEQRLRDRFGRRYLV